jgi:hypothetical protein
MKKSGRGDAAGSFPTLQGRWARRSLEHRALKSERVVPNDVEALCVI